LAASGTWQFNPALGSIGTFAFGRCGIRRPQITIEHLTDMQMAANLVLVDWSVDQPNLWGVVLNSFSMVQGMTEYTLPSQVLLVLDVFRRTTVSGVANDTILYGVSRSEYASYPNKLMQAPPTVYWADRVQPIQMSFYPTPDGNGPYTLFYYAVQQDQDAAIATAFTGGTQLSTPYRMLSAFADALAAKLALSYPPPAPMTIDILDKVAARSYAAARATENENVPMFITPGLSSYYNQR
jgi:hypothetical protein